jgi:hypothetical protein
VAAGESAVAAPLAVAAGALLPEGPTHGLRVGVTLARGAPQTALEPSPARLGSASSLAQPLKSTPMGCHPRLT